MTETVTTQTASIRLASGAALPAVGPDLRKIPKPHTAALVQTAERLGKSAAQIVLRRGMRRGTAVVPKTTRPARLAENLAIFDFERCPAEMQAISALDRNRRFNNPGVFCEAAFHTFFPIYESSPPDRSLRHAEE